MLELQTFYCQVFILLKCLQPRHTHTQWRENAVSDYIKYEVQTEILHHRYLLKTLTITEPSLRGSRFMIMKVG